MGVIFCVYSDTIARYVHTNLTRNNVELVYAFFAFESFVLFLYLKVLFCQIPKMEPALFPDGPPPPQKKNKNDNYPYDKVARHFPSRLWLGTIKSVPVAESMMNFNEDGT